MRAPELIRDNNTTQQYRSTVVPYRCMHARAGRALLFVKLYSNSPYTSTYYGTAWQRQMARLQFVRTVHVQSSPVCCFGALRCRTIHVSLTQCNQLCLCSSVSLSHWCGGNRPQSCEPARTTQWKKMMNSILGTKCGAGVKTEQPDKQCLHKRNRSGTLTMRCRIAYFLMPSTVLDILFFNLATLVSDFLVNRPGITKNS